MAPIDRDLTPVSTLIEVLAQEVATLWPDRVLVALEQVSLGMRPRAEEASRLRTEIVREASGLVMRVLGPEGPALTARLQLADHLPAPPSTGVPIPACVGAANGAALYALEQGPPEAAQVSDVEGLQALRAVRPHGPAGLIAELDVRRGGHEPQRKAGRRSTAAVMEGMLQLARWAWFALAGEQVRVDGLERMTCFRFPRAGETLRLEALLRSASADLPRFDVLACGVGGEPILIMRGLRLVPRASPSAEMARRPWQQFLRRLHALHPVPGASA